MTLHDDDAEYRRLLHDWSGDYDNPEEGCVRCGRHRVLKCVNGKHRCEKCNWSPELNDFAPVDN